VIKHFKQLWHPTLHANMLLLRGSSYVEAIPGGGDGGGQGGGKGKGGGGKRERGNGEGGGEKQLATVAPLFENIQGGSDMCVNKTNIPI
jgi:hypothetical protein